MNGNLEMDRKHSIASQPPMHLHYPPKPQQLLNPHLNSSGLGRAPMPLPEMSFETSSLHRVNSVAYPNNPGAKQPTNFTNSRGSGQHLPMGYQQDNFGPNSTIPQSHQSLNTQMRVNRPQFQAPSERIFPQNVSSKKTFYF